MIIKTHLSDYLESCCFLPFHIKSCEVGLDLLLQQAPPTGRSLDQQAGLQKPTERLFYFIYLLYFLFLNKGGGGSWWASDRCMTSLSKVPRHWSSSRKCVWSRDAPPAAESSLRWVGPGASERFGSAGLRQSCRSVLLLFAGLLVKNRNFGVKWEVFLWSCWENFRGSFMENMRTRRRFWSIQTSSGSLILTHSNNRCSEAPGRSQLLLPASVRFSFQQIFCRKNPK